MTALPVQVQPQAERHSEWYTVEEAARLLGISEGQVRRRAPRWAQQGAARKARGAWSIHTSADPRLNRAPIEQTETGGSAVTELLKSAGADKIAEAQTRAQIVVAFRAWRASGVSVKDGLPAFVAAMEQQHGLRPSKSTLYEWDKACPASTDFDGCVAELLDTRGRPRSGTTTVSDAAWDYFCALYLTTQQLSIQHCSEMTRAAAAEHGWGWPSHSRVKQLVRERIDDGTKALRRHGVETWQRNHQAPIQQDPDAWEAGQCWEGDHTPFDFSIRVRDGSGWRATRAQLTAWLDRRTRRLMGWCISEQGNQATIRTALIDALKRDGVSVPEVVWIDNGKDFMAASIGGLTKAERRSLSADERRQAEGRCAGLLGMLSIEPHFALPYNHNGKARVERFFGTVHQRFDRLFETWCGSDPGMVERKKLNAKLRDVLSLPTLDDLREQFTQWAEWYNHRSEHQIADLADPDTGQALSPAEFYQRFLPRMRAVKRDVLPLLGKTWSRPLAVHKHGLSLTLAGRVVRYGETEPALEPLVGSGRRVYVSYDPGDTGSVEVWDEHYKHICTARENGRHGGLASDAVSVADRRAAHNKRRDQKRRARHRADLLTLSLSDVELASKAAREREIEETQARMVERGHEDPPPIRLVQTPLDASEQPEQARRAAGGEADEFPTVAQSLVILQGRETDRCQPDPAFVTPDADDLVEDVFSLNLDHLGGDE